MCSNIEISSMLKNSSKVFAFYFFKNFFFPNLSLGLSCTIELFLTLKVVQRHLQKKKNQNQVIIGANNSSKALAKKKTPQKPKNQNPKIKLFSTSRIAYMYL